MGPPRAGGGTLGDRDLGQRQKCPGWAGTVLEAGKGSGSSSRRSRSCSCQLCGQGAPQRRCSRGRVPGCHSPAAAGGTGPEPSLGDDFFKRFLSFNKGVVFIFALRAAPGCDLGAAPQAGLGEEALPTAGAAPASGCTSAGSAAPSACLGSLLNTFPQRLQSIGVRRGGLVGWLGVQTSSLQPETSRTGGKGGRVEHSSESSVVSSSGQPPGLSSAWARARQTEKSEENCP